MVLPSLNSALCRRCRSWWSCVMCPPQGLRTLRRQFLAPGEDSDGGEVGRRVNRKACLRRHQVIYLSFQLNISNCLCLDLFGENVQRTDTKDLKVRCVPNHIKIATTPMCRVKWWLVFYNFYINDCQSQIEEVLVGVFIIRCFLHSKMHGQLSLFWPLMGQKTSS